MSVMYSIVTLPYLLIALSLFSIRSSSPNVFTLSRVAKGYLLHPLFHSMCFFGAFSTVSFYMIVGTMKYSDYAILSPLAMILEAIMSSIIYGDSITVIEFAGFTIMIVGVLVNQMGDNIVSTYFIAKPVAGDLEEPLL